MADKGGGGVPLKKKRGLLDSILWVAICAAVGAGLALSQADKGGDVNGQGIAGLILGALVGLWMVW